MSSKNNSGTIFPFAPGIQWKVHNGFLVPKPLGEQWNKAIAGKQKVILAHGGLAESLFSLSIAEMLSAIYPNETIHWAGDERFIDIIKMNGLGVKFLSCPKELKDKYPTPIFFDKENFVYFNCLNNYVIRKSLDGMNKKKTYKLLFNQVFNNALAEWKSEYKPKLRNIDNETFNEWCKANDININQRYILIFPEKGMSQDRGDFLFGWDLKSIKEFIAMMSKFKTRVIIATNDKRNYFNVNATFVPMNLKIIIPLIKSAWILLSRELDFYMAALLISKAHLFMHKIDWRPADMFAHAELFGSICSINSTKYLTPHDIYTVIENE